MAYIQGSYLVSMGGGGGDQKTSFAKRLILYSRLSIWWIQIGRDGQLIQAIAKCRLGHFCYYLFETKQECFQNVTSRKISAKKLTHSMLG